MVKEKIQGGSPPVETDIIPQDQLDVGNGALE